MKHNHSLNSIKVFTDSRSHLRYVIQKFDINRIEFLLFNKIYLVPVTACHGEGHVAIMHWSPVYRELITWLPMNWSRDCPWTDHVPVHALFSWLSCIDHVADLPLITWLIIHWSRNSSCTDHEADLKLITCLCMHWSRGWSCTKHVAYHVLIRWLSCNDHVADHTLITWLIKHWSRDWSSTDHVSDHALITMLIRHWSGGYHALITWLIITDHVTSHALITCLSCTDHVTAHALIMWMIIHWSREWSRTELTAQLWAAL